MSTNSMCPLCGRPGGYMVHHDLNTRRCYLHFSHERFESCYIREIHRAEELIDEFFGR